MLLILLNSRIDTRHVGRIELGDDGRVAAQRLRHDFHVRGHEAKIGMLRLAGRAGQVIVAQIVGAKLGLAGPWTSTTATDALASKLDGWLKKRGPYPHGKLEKMSNGKKKQAARLVKCWCDECGYTARITLKWILAAPPLCIDPECPMYLRPMQVALEGGGEDEEGYMGSTKVRPL